MIRKPIFIILLSLVIHILVKLWKLEKYATSTLRGEYFIKKNLVNAEMWGNDFVAIMSFRNVDKFPIDRDDVTLATQCSVNNLHYLPEMAARWNGSLSIAVFAPHSDFVKAVLGVHWLMKCFPRAFSKTQFHFVYPLEHSPFFSDKELPLLMKDIYLDSASKSHTYCSNAIKTIKSFKGGNYVLHGLQYPHNTLRNVAMDGVKTDFVFVLDVDTFPALNTRSEFIKFVKSGVFDGTFSKSETVFVIPAFEAREGVSIPTTKTNLLREYKRGNVRPFHSETCRHCQEPTKFSDWVAIPEKPELFIAYEAGWKESWEPFYITHKQSLPKYDERFRQYGFDRISQVCELFVSGYKFIVTNNIFVVHQGFKRPHEFHSSKNLENKRNYKIFIEEFLPDLAKKYPTSNRTCTEGGKRKGKAKLKFRPHFKIVAEKKSIEL